MGTCRPGRRVAGGRQGIGRFVYTPILPLMTAQAGLTPKAGASLATANYIGYLLGALAVTLEPRLVRSSMVHRGSLVLLVFTLAAMPLTHTTAGWFVLRLLAGIASAVVFVIVVNSLLSHLRDHPRPTSGMGAGRRRGRHRPVRRPSADAEPGGRHSNPPSRIDWMVVTSSSSSATCSRTLRRRVPASLRGRRMLNRAAPSGQQTLADLPDLVCLHAVRSQTHQAAVVAT
jgi:hypothetical protein